MRVTKKLLIVFVLGGVILFGLSHYLNNTSLEKAYAQDFQKSSENEKAISPGGIDGSIKRVKVRKVTELQWRDSEDQKPISYGEWKEKVGEGGPFEIKLAQKNSNFRLM